MDHADHVALLAPFVPAGEGGTWADVGAGEGAFTLALADLLGPGGRIVSIDRDARALEVGAGEVDRRFPNVGLERLVGDFRRPLELPLLDGLVAANAIHFVERPRQVEVVAALARHLRPGGRFVVVEYDADRGNPWVPNPFSAASWPAMAEAAGLVDVEPGHRVPTRFLRAIWSGGARRPAT